MIRRSLNFRVLIVTVVVLAIAGVGLAVVHRWQVGRTASGLIALADAKQKENAALDDAAPVKTKVENSLKAAEYLDRYLRLRPQDGNARVRLALAMGRAANEGNVREINERAIDLYYRALSAGLKDRELELRLDLAEILYKTRRFHEAEQEATKVVAGPLAAGTVPDSPRANRVLALARISQYIDGSLGGQSLKELKLLKLTEDASKLNPNDVELASRLASLYRDYPQIVLADHPKMTEPERRQKADDALNDLIRNNPENAKAFLARYLYRLTYAQDGAAADLERAVTLGSDESLVLLAAAEDALQNAGKAIQAKSDSKVVQDLLTLARGHFERIIELPDDQVKPQAYLQMGTAWLLASDVEKAIAAWRTGLKALDPDRTPATRFLEFHARIADACIDHGRLAEAETELNRADSLLSKLTGVDRDQKLLLGRQNDLRHARWQLARRDLAAALDHLKTVINSHSAGPAQVVVTIAAFWIRGNVFASLGEWREAAVSYDEASRLQPTATEFRLAAANAWTLAGRPDEARKQAEAAQGLAATPDAWLAVAVAQLQFQNQQPPADRNWARLEQALEALEKVRDQLQKTATPWQLDLLRVDYLVNKTQTEGKPQEGVRQAQEVLLAAETRFRAESRFWQQLVLVYEILHLPADANRALEEFRKSGGTLAEVARTEAHLAGMREDYPQAKAILTAAMSKASTTEQPQLQAELLRVALAARDLEQARIILLAQHEQNRKSLAVLRMLAELDFDRKDLAAVQAWEKKILDLGAHAAPLAEYFAAWRTYLTAGATDTAQIEAALGKIQRTVAAQPNWPEAVALKALLEHRLNRIEQALADYQTAVQLGERRLFVFEQFLALLDSLGRSEEVDRYLARLEAKLPISQRLTEIASNPNRLSVAPQEGIEIARQSAAKRPEDFRAQLWLARVLMVNEQNAEAEETFLKTARLAPGEPQVWNALLAFYARRGQVARIKNVLAELEANKAIDPGQQALLLGLGHDMLGNQEDASRHFTTAAEKAPADLMSRLRVAQYFIRTDPVQAKKHLNAALTIDPNSNAAKRMLAIVHATLGDMTAAANLLTETTKEGVTAADDVRLHVLLLMQQGGQANVGRAATLMEDVVARDPKTVQPTDRMLLARLYERQAAISDDPATAQARRERVVEQLRSLAESPQADPMHIASLIQFHWRHGDKKSAASWLNTLEERVQEIGKRREDANAISILIQAQVLIGAAAKSEAWLQRLEAVDSLKLRPLALRAQVALALNNQEDVEALIEPEAAKLLAAAESPQEKQQLYRDLGDMYVLLKRHAAAEKWFRLLVAEAPKQFAVVAASLANQGRIREAIDLCLETSRSDDSAQPAVVLAAILVNGKTTAADAAHAEQFLSAALNKHDKNVELLYAAALARVVQQDADAAVALFRKVVELAPRSVAALNNLAMILAERPADRAEALRLIDSAIAVAGKDPGLLDTKGAILLYSGRSGEAVPLLESATRDTQADARHHFHLAAAYRDQGKTEEAKAQLKTALDRQLTALVLTPTDQKLLGELRTALNL